MNEEKIFESFDNILGQLKYGYVDFSGCYDEDELEIIKQSVEKQIPQKVINKGHLYAYACFCPVCNSIVSTAPSYDEANYCYKCGQALDWSE